MKKTRLPGSIGQLLMERHRLSSMGNNLTGFLRELGLEGDSRGSHSSAHNCREQMNRLLLARLTYHMERPREPVFRRHVEAVARQDVLVSSKSVLWWDHQDEEAPWKGESWLELSREFHEMMRTGPIPVRMSVLHAIKKSPLALDLYALLRQRLRRSPKIRTTTARNTRLPDTGNAPRKQTARRRRYAQIPFPRGAFAGPSSRLPCKKREGARHPCREFPWTTAPTLRCGAYPVT